MVNPICGDYTTWPGLFARKKEGELWFEGNLFIRQYQTHFPDHPREFLWPDRSYQLSRLFFFATKIRDVALDTGEGPTQGSGYAASIAIEYLSTSPEILHLPAMAVDENWRQCGIGTGLFNYSVLMLSLMFRDRQYIHLWGDTNLNPAHVSGGYGPWPTWQKWGMKEIGPIPGYRAMSKNGDTGIVFGENVHTLRNAIIAGSQVLNEWWRSRTQDIKIPY